MTFDVAQISGPGMNPAEATPARKKGNSSSVKTLTFPLMQSPPASGQEEAGHRDSVEMQRLKQAVVEVNEAIQMVQRDLQFTIDEDSGRQVVKVIDHESKEVIRQYPADEILAMSRNLQEVAGLLLKEQA